MGAKSSVTHNKDTNLTKEEIDHLCNLFRQVCTTKPEKGCTYDDFVKFCNVLHPLLTNFLVQFYFGDHSGYIIKSVKEFSSFYIFLIRGSIVDRAKVMQVLLLNINPGSARDVFLTGASAYRKFDNLPINFDVDEETFKTNTENYFRGLICSYIKLEYTVECEEFLSWRYVKSSFSPQDVDRLANTLSESYPRPITSDNFEKWAKNWKSIENLHYVVYNQLFGMEYIHRGALQSLYPLCLVKNNYTVCIMDMCSILYLCSHLPAKYRNTWKLLFSSSQHGVNYQHLMRRILYEGPTIVVIKDVNNYVFGGFAAESWRPSSRFYGYCGSFLFQSKPTLRIFHASGHNDGYQYIHVKNKPKGFGMGKAAWGNFAWWIEPERLRGTCGHSCSTFEDVPILASSQFFKIEEFEVWGVEDSKARQKREQIIRFHTFAQVQRDQESNLQDAGKVLLTHAGTSKYKTGYTSTWIEEKMKRLEGDEESTFDYSYKYKDVEDEDDDDDNDSDESAFDQEVNGSETSLPLAGDDDKSERIMSTKRWS